MSTDNFWGTFRRWRRLRPFWGGLFLILSAAEMFLSSNMDIDGMQVHLGPQGFLSYVLPLVLLLCGLLSWFTPAQRLFYGIVALLAALFSFVGLNLGGFFAGMLLGIVGGGLVIAWGPPRLRPGAGTTETPSGGEPGDSTDSADSTGSADSAGDDSADGRTAPDLDETQTIPIAGHDDRPPYGQQVRPSAQETAIIPGFPQHAAPRDGLGKNPKAMVLALVPLAATAALFVAGSNQPASADECPKGMPSRSVPATKAPARTSASPAAPAAKAPEEKATSKPAPPSRAPSGSSESSASADPGSDSGSGSGSDSDGPSNPILDGIENFFDGVGNLLGINGDETPSPSASPSPSEEPSSGPSSSAGPGKPAEPGTSGSAAPGKSASASSSAEPGPADDVIPCLGPRVMGKVASADDIPLVSATPGVMKVASLTMYNSTYDGVVDMPVAGGSSFKALKFSMDKAVNKPFNLTIDEPGKATTVITSDELTTDGTVRFYTPEFKGKLFGLIPVTFTPESPPPLTLPVLWFTDATIQLAYVRSDILTGDPLKVQEKS